MTIDQLLVFQVTVQCIAALMTKANLACEDTLACLERVPATALEPYTPAALELIEDIQRLLEALKQHLMAPDPTPDLEALYPRVGQTETPQ